MAKKIIDFTCERCGGTGWYNQQANLGCVYCGGLNRGKEGVNRQGTGISRYNNYLKNEVFNEFISCDEAVNKVAAKLGTSREFAVKYLNWMYIVKKALYIQEGKAIDVAKKPRKKRTKKS